jgi:hypothetical protein
MRHKKLCQYFLNKHHVRNVYVFLCDAMYVYFYVRICVLCCYVQRKCQKEISTFILSRVGRDSVVGIATCYGLEGPGIESRWGRDFPQLSRPAPGPAQPPIQWVPGLCRG